MSSNFSKNLTSSMGISLGGLEVVTDFLFTNPEFYESDIADVKSTMYGQPVAKQHYEKPVRPKKTKEAIMNKFSIIQRKPVIQSDEIFESPIIASEDTSFDDSFDDMEITSNNKNNNDNNNDNYNDTEILEANALLQKLSNIQNSGDMSAISSALDIDDEDDDLNIVDEDSDEDIDNIDDDDINIVDDDDDLNIVDDEDDFNVIDDDDDFNIVDEDSEDEDSEDEDSEDEDSEDDDLNIVDDDDDLNIVDEDSEDDDLNIVDGDSEDEEAYSLNDDDNLNIVDDDDDINIVDDDDEYDTDADEETFDLDDLNIEEPSNSKKDTNAVSTEKLNEKEEAVLSDYENNFNLNTKQETKDSKKDSENDELKLMKKRFAELEKQLHELQNEKASNNTSNLVENNNKDLKTDSIDSIIEKAKHRKAGSDTKNDASEDIHLKYTCMSVESLYKEVKDYMNELGVRQKVIDVSTLNDKFGEKNIRKLIQKSYLIKIGSKGVTTGR